MTQSPIKLGYPSLDSLETQAVSNVLSTKTLAAGTEVATFEKEFSEGATNNKLSIALNSGTSALHVGMLAAGIREGDEVIVPSFTFAATANAVALTGATPVFADITADTFTLNPEDVIAKISSNTKAILVVHLYGQMANMTEFKQICKTYNLMLFEDAAQAHIGQWDDVYAGSWGEFGAFSFYPTKNMTSGEGGMIVTGNENLARNVRLLRNQGMEKRYHNEIVGFNNRMSDVHAAIGRVQLTKLENFTVHRRKNADILNQNLQKYVEVPFVHPQAFHVYHQYTIKVPANKRNNFVNNMASFGVETGVYYPVPVHRLPAFNNTNVNLPVTETLINSVVSLPVHPNLSDSDLEHIIDAAKQSIKDLK